MLKNELEFNSFVSLKILEALMQKNLTDEQKAKIIAEGFAELETRYPDLGNVVTKRELSETELRLIKEIEAIRADTKALDSKLSKEMREIEVNAQKDRDKIRSEMREIEINAQKDREKIRFEMKELDANAQKERDNIRLEIEKVRGEIKSSSITTIKWIIGFGIATIGSIFTAFRLLGV